MESHLINIDWWNFTKETLTVAFYTVKMIFTTIGGKLTVIFFALVIVGLILKTLFKYRG